MDLEELDFRLANLKMLGSKGTTGTQASFMELFEGDSTKVKKLEQMIAEEMGFTGVVPVSGQTYSRKIDSQILDPDWFVCNGIQAESDAVRTNHLSVPLCHD